MITKILSDLKIKLTRGEVKEDKNNIKILVIEDSNDLAISLGITNKRIKELGKVLESNLTSSVRFSDLMQKTSTEIKHVNELAFISFIIGRSSLMPTEELTLKSIKKNLYLI